MVRPLLISFLASSLAYAAPALTSRQATNSTTATVLVGAPGQILTYNFDGKSFNGAANNSAAGTAPSWMIFKEPNLLYVNDENSNLTRLFNFDPKTNTLSTDPVSSANGSLGVVTYAFNQDKTRLLGGSYSLGQVDVWDISAADGSLKLLKQTVLEGPLGPVTSTQTVHRAHEIVPHPGGRFFIINDLGGDAIHVLDSKDDKWEITNRVQVQPAGAGPRHGAFIGDRHYAVACELSSDVLLFEVSSGNGSLALTQVQTLKTYDPARPPANLTSTAAGELVVADNQRDIYISNRLTGNDTDNIAHFQAVSGGNCSYELQFVDQISSGGILPRMFSLNSDETLLFSSNQQGADGLLALQRCPVKGTLTEQPVAIVANTSISSEVGFGPQFIQQII